MDRNKFRTLVKGGPVGAAAGAVVGVAGNAVSIGIKALVNTGFGIKVIIFSIYIPFLIRTIWVIRTTF